MKKTPSILNYYAKNVAIYAFLLLKTEEFGNPSGVKHLTKSTAALQKVLPIWDPSVYLSPHRVKTESEMEMVLEKMEKIKKQGDKEGRFLKVGILN